LIWRDAQLRIILADEPDYPGFCRVIWNAHVAEFSELDPAQQQYLMQTVSTVERVVRDVMAPDKMNLASLGNQVPHLHWHLIPRYRDDPHFPLPVWAARQREVDAVLVAQRNTNARRLAQAVCTALTVFLPQG
jgi:diadenosine tetraphosphate (Ap4A) HIT family hydrolase